MLIWSSILGANKHVLPNSDGCLRAGNCFSAFALQLSAAACLQLDIVAKFKDANLEFDVATVIDSEVMQEIIK